MADNMILTISLIIFVILFLIVLVLQVVVKSILKKYHMGKPDEQRACFNDSSNSISGSLSFVKFLAKKKYNQIKDARLTIYCDALRAFYLIYALVFFWVCYEILFELPS